MLSDKPEEQFLGNRS